MHDYKHTFLNCASRGKRIENHNEMVSEFESCLNENSLPHGEMLTSSFIKKS